MTKLTLKEQERRAYIAGNIPEAELLGRILDGDDEMASDLQQVQEQLKSEERDNELLREEIKGLEDKVTSLEAQRCICA